MFKSLGVPSKGASAAMRDIEILPNGETGAPEVTLHDDAKKAAESKGIGKVLISLSHSEVRFGSIGFKSVLIMLILADCCHRFCPGPNLVVIVLFSSRDIYSYFSLIPSLRTLLSSNFFS